VLIHISRSESHAGWKCIPTVEDFRKHLLAQCQCLLQTTYQNASRYLYYKRHICRYFGWNRVHYIQRSRITVHVHIMTYNAAFKHSNSAQLGPSVYILFYAAKNNSYPPICSLYTSMTSSSSICSYKMLC